MSRLLLDSTVLIDALRGRPPPSGSPDFDEVGTEPWVVRHLRRGDLAGSASRRGEARRRLFRGLRLAPLGQAEGERAGTWRRSFAQHGVTLHQADCLIAAAAVGVGATLATANVDDFPMDELIVEAWPVGA